MKTTKDGKFLTIVYPEWLRRIYQIRFEVEGIDYSKHYQIKNRISEK